MITEDLRKTFGNDLEVKVEGAVNRIYIKAIKTGIEWSETTISLPEKLRCSAEKELFTILCKQLQQYLNM